MKRDANGRFAAAVALKNKPVKGRGKPVAGRNKTVKGRKKIKKLA